MDCDSVSSVLRTTLSTLETPLLARSKLLSGDEVGVVAGDSAIRQSLLETFIIAKESLFLYFEGLADT